MDMKGRGLNSIPIRFGLMTVVLGGIATLGLYQAMRSGLSGWALVLSVALVIMLPALVTFLAARKLTSQIRALRQSTEALVAGDFNSPVEVDCACEVGGLADSFRKMVSRLNSNILRMNVLAYTDGITQLPNRAVILHLLERMTGTPGVGPAALLFVDLDGFKRINDMYGHDVGDELLRRVSGRIARGLGRTLEELDTCVTPMGELCDEPPRDIVLARVSGDEFVVILPHSSESAEDYATAILTQLETSIDIAETEVHVGASIGLARFPEDADTSAKLLNLADLAMYEAKREGRGRMVAVSPALLARWQERRDVEGDLRRALDAGEIVLAYQPRFRTGDLACVSVEALARWNHPERGSISPAAFIPIAEQAGLMPLLGAVVFEQAVRQARAWQDRGLSLAVSVNVSPAEFADPNLAPRLLSVLHAHDVDPALVEIEITETMAMGDFETTREQMLALRDAGLRIAIDDFGTGYSNLSQLARLPYSAIKLDRSLILDVTGHASGREILYAITAIAKALGHTTIAEGVETQAQYRALRDLGCDEVQGFLFAKPMAPEAVIELIARAGVDGDVQRCA